MENPALEPYTSTSRFNEHAPKRLYFFHWNCHPKTDITPILGLRGTEIKASEYAFDGALVGVGCGDVQRLGFLHLYDIGLSDRFTGSAPVGANESALSQLGTSEVPGHHDRDSPQFGTIDVIQDGLASRAAWLSIIVDSKALVAHSQAPGKAVVAGVRVLGSDGLYEAHGLISSCDWSTVPEKPRALDWLRLYVHGPGEC